MKAMVYHGNKDLRYETVDEPSPGPGEVKLRIDYCGICATDIEEYIYGPKFIDSCRWSTIMSVVNRSGKMSVHERIDIDPERTGKAPSAQRYPGRSDISG